jgi:antitoxin (DNA-binding transcriptional repressor) of toxin-antitoxin stability system
MSTQLIHVGAREFRESLAEYLDSPVPIAVTRHGRTVGYYVPAHRKINKQEVQALTKAVDRLTSLMDELGIDEDDIVREFDALRHARG